MQVWTWVLVSCLATVWARPEGGPAPLQAAVVVGDDAADNKAELVVVAEETRPEVLVIDEAKVETSAKEPEDAMQPMPVPIEPGVMTPDDSKVFPEGSLRSPTPAEDSRVLLEEEPAQLPVVNAVEIPVMVAPGAAAAQQGGARMTRASYLPAEARGADSEDIELNLAPDAVLVPYYGGAKGQYLIVARPVAAADLFKKKKSNKKKPGHKEEEEEEENVGEEADEEKPKPPPSDSSDTVTIVQPPPNASMAEAKPVGIAVAGEGGVASSRPQATALVGPGGLAVAKPIATAVAGIQGAEILLSGAGGLSGFSAGHPATLLYPVGSGPGPVHPLGGPLTTVYLHQAGVHPVPVAQPLQPLPPQPWLVYPAPPPPPFPYA